MTFLTLLTTFDMVSYSAAAVGRLLISRGDLGCDCVPRVCFDSKKDRFLLSACAPEDKGRLFAVGAVEAQWLCDLRESTQDARKADCWRGLDFLERSSTEIHESIDTRLLWVETGAAIALVLQSVLAGSEGVMNDRKL